MAILAEFILENFQSHKFTVLNFHPNLNALVGTSNHGKSSVLRGIDFLETSAWSKSYVRHGEKESKLTARYEDGFIVERIKGTGNKAALVDPNGKREEYSGFGDTLPSDIITVLGTPEFRIDQDKSIFVNLARQHDPPFLLKEAGSFRAKILGRLSGLHLIDIAIRGLNNDSRNATQRLVVEKDRIDTAKRELEKYIDLDLDKEKLVKLKEEVELQQNLRQKAEKIQILLRKIDSFNRDVGSNREKKERLASYDMEALKKEFVKKLMDSGICPTCRIKFTEESAQFCLDANHV